MSQNLPALPSAASLAAVLSEEQLHELVKTHAALVTAGTLTKATQAEMADDQLFAFATAVSTMDTAARMVAGSQALNQEQLALFHEMQNHYLGNVFRVVTRSNSARVARLTEALAAISGNG